MTKAEVEEETVEVEVSRLGRFLGIFWGPGEVMSWGLISFREKLCFGKGDLG